MFQTRKPILWAIGAATLSGAVSAISLEPAMQLTEVIVPDEFYGLLTTFAVTAGLAFGLCGAAVAVWAMGGRATGGLVFLLTSMIGIVAAVYLAILSFDNSSDSFILPYALGSPLGALIVAVPFAFAGRFLHPWRVIGLATALPTLWAIGVASAVSGDSALEVPWLAALYIGWQAIFLGLFAAAARRT